MLFQRRGQGELGDLEENKALDGSYRAPATPEEQFDMLFRRPDGMPWIEPQGYRWIKRRQPYFATTADLRPKQPLSEDQWEEVYYDSLKELDEIIDQIGRTFSYCLRQAPAEWTARPSLSCPSSAASARRGVRGLSMRVG